MATSKKIAIAVSVPLALILAAVALTFAVGGGQYLTAPFRGEVAERERVQADPDFRIASYERFYDLRADACAIVQQHENQQNMPKGAIPEEQRQTNLLALSNQYASVAQDYNAQADKTDTRANFLASDLPYTLTPNIEESTACAA